WDTSKAIGNYRKHDVNFLTAMLVFEDARALSRYDVGHSETEERWATVGTANKGDLLLVVHTFVERDAAEAEIRIISARKATRNERSQYEELSNFYRVQEPMEPEYDFSGAERGRFYRPGVVLEAPIHIDPALHEPIREQAKAMGITPSELVNDLIRR